jgi:hypothetical protein
VSYRASLRSRIIPDTTPTEGARLNNYQKTAIFIIRLVGICWTLFFGFIWSVYGIEALIGIEVQRYPAHTLIGNLGYIALGVVATVASKPLGRFIGRGLGD